MHCFALVTLQALLMGSSVYAQNVIADIWVYSTQECAGDAFGESLDLTVYDTNKVLSGGTWNCMYTQDDLPGFNKSGSSYSIFVDENTIPDDCQLVLYQGAPTGDQTSSGPCQTFYATIPNKDGSCIETTIAPRFGYALCCGPDCEAATQPPPSAKGEASPAQARDVTSIKRTSPLDALSRRDDCKFSGSGDSLESYGPQVRVVNSISCSAGNNGCSQSVTFSYSSSTTNTFGVSTELGATFLEVLSASVSFSAEVSTTTEQSYSVTGSVNIPQGQSGYLTFSPRYECSPNGSFSGDCADGIPLGTDGQVCFPVFVGGVPDGPLTFVQAL